MKKRYFIIWAAMLLILTTSCGSSIFEANDKIIAPGNKKHPIQGKWTIEKAIDSPYNKGNINDVESLVGKEALFHQDAIVVGEDYVMEPNYKYKDVNLSDYLLYKYKIYPADLDLEVEQAQILTIYSKNQYFYEFIKYSDEEMVTFVDDRFYFLKRNVEQISKEEIERYINIEQNIMRISNIEDVDTLRTGVLLGIKSPVYDEVSQSDTWEYKTIWIRFNNHQLASAYEMEDLLVPRKKGFWLVDVNRENGNDKIRAEQKNIFPEEELEMSSNISVRTFDRVNYGISPIHKNIMFIGNDYVSTESTDTGNNRSTLKVYPIDYLEDDKAIKISDIIGEEGLIAFVEGSQSIIKRDSSVLLDEENFGLFRRNGYWIMKGRMNYQSSNEELFMDFNIKTIPPKELVNYDELTIPWNIIKSRVPEAIDAFTSPNDDIIIIVTRNNLLIYSIIENEISQKELGRIKLDSSETIVMAEWGLGRYAMLWEEEVLKSESATEVEY